MWGISYHLIEFYVGFIFMFIIIRIMKKYLSVEQFANTQTYTQTKIHYLKLIVFPQKMIKTDQYKVNNKYPDFAYAWIRHSQTISVYRFICWRFWKVLYVTHIYTYIHWILQPKLLEYKRDPVASEM